MYVGAVLMDLMDLSKVTFSLRRDGQSQRYFGNKN